MANGTSTAENGAERVRRPGTFQPGCKPGPGRQPKTDALRLAEKVSKAEAQQAIERLMGPAITRIEKAIRSKSEQTGLQAALAVLDRALGKPLQRVDATVTSNETTTVVTPAMLRLAAARLLAANAEDVEAVDAGPD